jgi:hypothetical protein
VYEYAADGEVILEDDLRKFPKWNLKSKNQSAICATVQLITSALYDRDFIALQGIGQREIHMQMTVISRQTMICPKPNESNFVLN